MEKFSSYSFNKAHSASYAAHGLPGRLPQGPPSGAVFRGRAQRGRRLLRPLRVRRGGQAERYPDPGAGREPERLCAFEVEAGRRREAIRVGLGSIKGLGPKTIDRVIGERTGGGEYASVEDFLARTKPIEAELLALIRAGVFDSLEPRRTRQILRYFQGLEHMEDVADVAPDEKRRMLYESLGFLPDGDDLDLYEGQRPGLRIRDLRGCAGTMVELVVRVVDARQRVTYGANGDGAGGARSGGPKYFYLFEDETGLLEGIGENRCVTCGTPPVCLLRGEVRKDGEGVAKIFNCSFLRSF